MAWLDGRLLIDQWHEQITSRHPATLPLDRQPHLLRIEFFKNPAYDKHNFVSFRWEEIGRGQEQVVPVQTLFHD